jgi:uncharacterized membrane protein YkoI
MRGPMVQIAAAAAAVLMVTGPARADDRRAEIGKALSAAKITVAQAVEAARKAVTDGTPVKVEFDPQGGAYAILVKFIAGDVVKAARVDAVTGKVTVEDVPMTAERQEAVSQIKPLLGAAKTDPAKAAAAATARINNGQVFQVEPDVKDGKLFYSVYLLAGDKVMEAVIDAATGAITTVAEAHEEDEDEEQASALNFDKDATGKLPEGWKAEGTNQKGPVATWQVTADPTAPSKPNALALTASTHGSSGTFNICWTDHVRFQDGTIELSLRPESGAEDQGGGPIWRVKDKDNYYICRANPLESNFRVYYVKDAVRKQLASAKLDIPSNKWHTIKIEQHGSHIVCSFDGQRLLEADDNTLPEAGGIGLWTKSDAVTAFDNLNVTPGGNDQGKAVGKGKAEGKENGKDEDDDDDND